MEFSYGQEKTQLQWMLLARIHPSHFETQVSNILTLAGCEPTELFDLKEQNGAPRQCKVQKEGMPEDTVGTLGDDPRSTVVDVSKTQLRFVGRSLLTISNSICLMAL